MEKMSKFPLSHLVLSLALAACASQPKATKHAESKKKADWDYERIRQARRAEEAAAPPPALRAQEEDCVAVSREQMIRARSSGCRPMDAREGAGRDMFCCPPSR